MSDLMEQKGPIPPDPERDGWHWLEWMDYCGTKPSGMIEQFKWEADGYWDRTTHRSVHYWKFWRYLGPVLTFNQATALQTRVARLEAGLQQLACRTVRERTDGGYRIVEAPEAAIARATLGQPSPTH